MERIEPSLAIDKIEPLDLADQSELRRPGGAAFA
jgi:hypothetical protein